MRVLHVVPGLAARTGGVAASVVETCHALRVAGVESSIFTTDLPATASAGITGPVTRDELPPGAGDLDIRIFRSAPPRRLAWSPGLHGALGREIGHFDLVHIHSLFLLPQWSGFRQARRHSTPHVVSPRGALDPYLRTRGRLRKRATNVLWQQRMLRSAALIVLTSAEEESLAAPVLPPRAPRLVIPNPVDLGQFDTLPSPDLFRQRYLGGHTGRIVMNIGRLAQKKGLDRLIRAFAGVARSAPDCLLVLAGPDDDGLRPQLEALAAEADVTERVVFPGMLRGEAKLSALAAATVWVLPSHTENFGVAVVEAMAAGVPTVISPAVNISPEVAAAHAGVVVSNEPEKLGAALARLLGDEQERARLSRAGQAFARRFDRFEVGRQLARAYQPIARSAKPLDLRAAAWGVDA